VHEHRGNYTKKPDVLQRQGLFCMVKRFLNEGKNIFYSKQTNVLSAAIIIMTMILASRLLGLVRNRVFVHYFTPEKLDTFLAAFQLPDLIFEILILGAMSSAFIPVFSNYINKGKEKESWDVAAITLNLLLVFFSAFSILIFIFAEPIYSTVAKGFSPAQVIEIASFTRILLIAQLFFIASYLITAVLESHQRFFVSAAAPLFYNVGIIGMTILFAPTLGLYAPVWGAVIGSILHFSVQIPVALKLGFRPVWSLDYKNPGVREIGKLALPRVLELSSFQIKKLSDLFLSSFVSGGLTYFKFSDSLSSLPIGLFGLSIAKASLPRLSLQNDGADLKGFKETLAASVKEILFLVIPSSIFLAVLRLPLVRLVYGGQKFDWDDTLQTGFAVSAFTVGIFAYSLTLLLSRAFYALRDTATPVKISILTIFLNAGLGFIFILGLHLPIWGLSLAYSLAGLVQVAILFSILTKRIGGFSGFGIESTVVKITTAATASGLTMYILLKILDRSAWDRKLSFLGHLGLALPTTFDKFILDTRYTINLIYVTSTVAIIGIVIYLALCRLMKVEELEILFKVLKRLPIVKLLVIKRANSKDRESITPPVNSN
jgi:putative peptidoglycan lipid II flippase